MTEEDLRVVVVHGESDFPLNQHEVGSLGHSHQGRNLNVGLWVLLIV